MWSRHIEWTWWCVPPTGRLHAYHRQGFAYTLFTRTLCENFTETLPGRAGRRLILDLDNRDRAVGTAFGADAAADATFCDIDLAIGVTRDARPAAQHAYGVVALPAGRSYTDIAYHHTLAVHARMPMPAFACLFALVAMNAFIQVDHQHLRPLHHAILYQ